MTTYRLTYGVSDGPAITQTLMDVELEREDGWLVIFRGTRAFLRLPEELIQAGKRYRSQPRLAPPDGAHEQPVDALRNDRAWPSASPRRSDQGPGEPSVRPRRVAQPTAIAGCVEAAAQHHSLRRFRVDGELRELTRASCPAGGVLAIRGCQQQLAADDL